MDHRALYLTPTEVGAPYQAARWNVARLLHYLAVQDTVFAQDPVIIETAWAGDPTTRRHWVEQATALLQGLAAIAGQEGTVLDAAQIQALLAAIPRFAMPAGLLASKKKGGEEETP